MRCPSTCRPSPATPRLPQSRFPALSFLLGSWKHLHGRHPAQLFSPRHRLLRRKWCPWKEWRWPGPSENRPGLSSQRPLMEQLGVKQPDRSRCPVGPGESPAAPLRENQRHVPRGCLAQQQGCPRHAFPHRAVGHDSVRSASSLPCWLLGKQDGQ